MVVNHSIDPLDRLTVAKMRSMVGSFPRGAEPLAMVGPLELIPAKTYDAEIAYAVLRPGNRSRAHTHAGPLRKSRRKRSSERPTTRNDWPFCSSFVAKVFPTVPVAPKIAYFTFFFFHCQCKSFERGILPHWKETSQFEGPLPKLCKGRPSQNVTRCSGDLAITDFRSRRLGSASAKTTGSLTLQSCHSRSVRRAANKSIGQCIMIIRGRRRVRR